LLFVTDKMAALEVVQQRLAAIGRAMRASRCIRTRRCARR